MEEGELIEELGRLHVHSARAMLRLCAALTDSGEAGVLLWLSERPGGVCAVDVSAHLGLTQGRVANIVKKLDERGWIARSQGNADQRLRVITLTGDGARQAESLRRDMTSRHKALVKALGEEDAERMTDILRRLAEKMDCTDD